jgi:hypothetical protein
VSTADKVALWSLAVSAVALFVAAVSLIVAVYAIRKGNRNSSVAIMLAISEAAREAWKRFRSATDNDTRSYELAELMNLLEVACAMVNERSIAGASKGLLQELLLQELDLIDSDDNAKQEIAKLLSAPHTFEHIRKFKEMRLHDTPRFWYRIVCLCFEKVKAALSISVRLCLYK